MKSAEDEAPVAMEDDKQVMLAAIALLVLATATIYAGSLLSVASGSSSVTARLYGESDEVQYETVTFTQALILPFYASACLLFFYFFFSYVQYLFISLILFSATLSLFYVLSIFIHHIMIQINIAPNSKHIWFAAFLLSAVTVLEYIHTGHFICHDLLGVALSILFIVCVRLPNVKIAFLTLTLLLVYDLFWVFYSEYFFQQNVMVEVASKVTSNPVHDLGERLRIDFIGKYFTQNLNLPIKLIVPQYDEKGWRYLMLGLGDIALPGSFVALTHRLDLYFAQNSEKDADIDVEGSRNSAREKEPEFMTNRRSTFFFLYTLLGYALGLCLAFFMSLTFKHAQPALIYIVPAIALSFVGRASAVGVFSQGGGGGGISPCKQLYAMPHHYIWNVNV